MRERIELNLVVTIDGKHYRAGDAGEGLLAVEFAPGDIRLMRPA